MNLHKGYALVVCLAVLLTSGAKPQYVLAEANVIPGRVLGKNSSETRKCEGLSG